MIASIIIDVFSTSMAFVEFLFTRFMRITYSTYFIVFIVSIYYALFSTFYYVTLYENWKKFCL